ncbi:hypothetical protein pb186bvf_006179 [Paramecium bursaria]
MYIKINFQDTEQGEDPIQLMLDDGMIRLIDQYISNSDNLDYQIPKPIPSPDINKILSQYDTEFITQFDIEFVQKLIKASSYLQFEHLEAVCYAYLASQALTKVVKEFTQKEYTYTKISY